MATRRSKRQIKGVKRELEKANVDTEGQAEPVSKNTITESTQAKMEEDRSDQDPQDIEVKGAADTVTVTWNKKKEEELEEIENGSDASNQVTDTGGEQDGVDTMEDAPIKNIESRVQQEVEELETEETQMDTSAEESESTTLNEMEDVEQESDDRKETDQSEEVVVQKKTGKGKRKAQTVETSPPKKTKLINDGFCVFVGNLNDSNGFQILKDSLVKYFMSQSLLFQDIRLDRSRKHAHIDLASQMDLTKALTLDGEMMLDKPMKIEVAKVKSENKSEKVKLSPEEKKAAKDARCLFLKNVPFNSTKEDILKSFHKAVTVRFPGGGEHPNHGIAFVEFKNKNIAEQVLQSKQVVEIQGRVLIVDSIRPKEASKVTETNDKDNTKAEVAPNKILYVGNLSLNAKEKNLRSVFPKAVHIRIPQSQGKSKRFAFVEFTTVADAEKALKASKKRKICQRAINVQFCEHEERKDKNVVSKTLVVKHLAENTTAETLKSAFDGALSARIILDKETKVSKRYGFVEFESIKESKSAKKAMEHCEIDGSTVTIDYAKQKSEKVSAGGRAASGERPAGQGSVRGEGARGGGKGCVAGSRKKTVKKIKTKIDSAEKSLVSF